MLAVAKCCLMAILRSDPSPALFPGLFSRYETHHSFAFHSWSSGRDGGDGWITASGAFPDARPGL